MSNGESALNLINTVSSSSIQKKNRSHIRLNSAFDKNDFDTIRKSELNTESNTYLEGQNAVY